MPCRYVRSNCSNVSFKACISLLIFCLDDLSIGVGGVFIKDLHYYCVAVNFPFNSCYHLPYVLRCSYLGCIYIHNYYTIVLSFSLIDHYVTSFVVSCSSLYFKVYFIWLLPLPFFFLNFYLQGITFSSCSLSVCMCP